MTREELLQECFGRSDFPSPLQVVSLLDEETGDVLSSVDVYLRRVRVRFPSGQTGSVGEAATTLTVAALAQVCTDPAHRGKGYARALVRRAHAEMREHGPISFAALFSDCPGLYAPLGYFHPEGCANPAFLVCKLRDEPWPEGRATPIGDW